MKMFYKPVYYLGARKSGMIGSANTLWLRVLQAWRSMPLYVFDRMVAVAPVADSARSSFHLKSPPSSYDWKCMSLALVHRNKITKIKNQEPIVMFPAVWHRFTSFLNCMQSRQLNNILIFYMMRNDLV